MVCAQGQWGGQGGRLMFIMGRVCVCVRMHARMYTLWGTLREEKKNNTCGWGPALGSSKQLAYPFTLTLALARTKLLVFGKAFAIHAVAISKEVSQREGVKGSLNFFFFTMFEERNVLQEEKKITWVSATFANAYISSDTVAFLK